MEKEIVWKEIPGFNGKYLVSNTSVIKSLFFGKEKILSTELCGGYLILGLSDENKKRKMYRVHRIVAITFLENNEPEIKTEVHHKDGNKLNNHVDNLEWCSHSENCHRDFINGTRKNQKNNIETIKKIRTLYENGDYTQKKLGEMFDLKQSIISEIVNNKKWSYIK